MRALLRGLTHPNPGAAGAPLVESSGMDGGMRYVVWGAAGLLAGCFSNPPVLDSGGDDTGSSTSSATSVSPTSGVTMPPGSTSEDATSSSTAGESGSSSSDATSSTGVLDTSGEDSSGESTAAAGCEADRVEIDEMCLTPLSVSNAFSVIGGIGGGAFDDAMPCLEASCGMDLPLGGGFEVTDVAPHSSHANFGAGSWDICGAAGEEPNTWDVSARCAVAEGDVFTETEPYALADDFLGCVDAGCPADTSLVGGGGRWGPNFEVTGSRPTRDGHWEVCGRGLGNGPEVEVDAYCAVLPAGASIQLAEEIELVDSVTLGCAQAVCPSGIAIAGGGDGGSISATFEVSRPTDAGEAWMTCGRANLPSGEIRSRVLCYQP